MTKLESRLEQKKRDKRGERLSGIVLVCAFIALGFILYNIYQDITGRTYGEYPLTVHTNQDSPYPLAQTGYIARDKSITVLLVDSDGITYENTYRDKTLIQAAESGLESVSFYRRDNYDKNGNYINSGIAFVMEGTQ